MNTFEWKTIRWIDVQQRLLRHQRRIYKASKAGLYDKMYKLQRRLMQDVDAKLMAVRCVTEPCAVNPMTLSSTQKMAVVDKLDINACFCWDGKRHAPAPNPCVLVEQRAKQMLAKFVLEPQWEALFESSSVGDTCHYDATQNVASALKETPQWVFVAQFSAVSQINHATLLTKLATFPEMEHQIRAWLKQGLLIDFEKSPDLLSQFIQGSPSDILGGFLVNVALHGLTHPLQPAGSFLLPTTNNRSTAITIVRYASSFLMMTPNQETFHAMIPQVDTWCQTEIGFLPSQRRTVYSEQGFDFLGFQFISIRQRTGNSRLKMHPSKKSQQRLIEQTRQLIQKNKSASSLTLIRLLSRPILGWANYFSLSDCKKDVAQLDSVLFHQMRAWVFRRTSKGLASRRKLKQKYFPKGKRYFFKGKWHQHNWILNGQSKDQNQSKTLFLPKMIWGTVDEKCVHKKEFKERHRKKKGSM